MSKQEMIGKILERFDAQSFAKKMQSVMRQGYDEDGAVEMVYCSIFNPQKAQKIAAEKRYCEMINDMRRLQKAIDDLREDRKLTAIDFIS